MFGITGLVAVLQLIALPFCPESPRYLLAIKNDEHSAIKSKCFFGTVDLAHWTILILDLDWKVLNFC